MAIGGLLFSLHPSQDFSFLQEKNITASKVASINKGGSIFFINEGFVGKVYLVVIITIPTKPLMLYHRNAKSGSLF
jgi:hypothetical protein